jgi:hypothetical protein
MSRRYELRWTDRYSSLVPLKMHETNAEPDSTQEGPAPDLAASVAGVVNAALGVGVSLARLMAEATALGKTVPPLPSGTPALQAIVRYGVTAMGNLAQAVVSGAQTQSKATSPAGEAAPAAQRGRPARVCTPVPCCVCRCR